MFGDCRMSVGEFGRHHGPQLHDRVVALLLHPAGAGHDALLVQRQVRGVEEEHLPDLRVERVHAERLDRRALIGLRHGQLQLDAVGVVNEARAAQLSWDVGEVGCGRDGQGAANDNHASTCSATRGCTHPFTETSRRGCEAEVCV